MINDAESQLAAQAGDHVDKQSSDGYQRLSVSNTLEAVLTKGSYMLTSESEASRAGQQVGLPIWH